jgi:GT2 family glycosyltransferase
MITIIYSTNKDENYNLSFESHLNKTSGLNNIQIIKFVNHDEFSLSHLYNRGIKESNFDIVVCVHNDIRLSKNWGKNLLSDFEKNPDYGIIGKAGSCYFPESGIYWERMNQTMVGQVYHHPPDKEKFLSIYSINSKELIPVITIDGLFISFNKKKIKHTFDESIGKFHFYDHLFCIPNFIDGVKIGVTSSFDITHQSVGIPNQEFFESKSKFLQKFKDVLPLDLKPNKILLNNNKSFKTKKGNKVAVIIPTKGKVDLLIECVDSFINNCKNNNYEIFIADTGSSDNDKDLIKSYLTKNTSVIINFIEYDYYNFAKINNDVVLNHVDDSFSHILFTNNDIKIITNVIDSMLSVFNESNKIGTVGGTLYFNDNTIQHNGIGLYYVKNKNSIEISHIDLKSYYPKENRTRKVVGCTGALLMIRKNVFNKIGGFNEEYINCFEDVELNLNCILHGYENYIDSGSVSYHYESQTRKDNPDNLINLRKDYNQRILPFIVKNINSFLTYLKHVN